MLSYQHGYHAGNHADVLKHIVLCRVLVRLNQKVRGWTYLDTHAGSGSYDLSGSMATKTGDADSGIHRLRGATGAPAAVANYLEQIATFSNKYKGEYPGSPLLAASFARDVDRLVCCERHPAEYETLSSRCNVQDAHIRCIEGDGFAAVKHALPPPTRRGAVLIDPSYERDEEWSAVINALNAGLRRFATGTWMVWYPRLQARDNRTFERQLRVLGEKDWLCASLDVASAKDRGFYGSSLFMINPPWTLEEELRGALPWLAKTLGGSSGGWSLDTSNPA